MSTRVGRRRRAAYAPPDGYSVWASAWTRAATRRSARRRGVRAMPPLTTRPAMAQPMLASHAAQGGARQPRKRR